MSTSYTSMDHNLILGQVSSNGTKKLASLEMDVIYFINKEAT